jgi:hypothetical protein
MAGKRSKEMEIGESFYKKVFGRSIKSRTNLILKISVLLLIIELIDEVPILLDVFQEDPALVLFSIVEIAVPVVLMIIIYVLVKELEKWEDTYKKVKKLIS